ncbi:MAG: hypothetical protein D6816_17070 [Bacteroidetes bacterium]|nr:MAG: hypothetical protein D6816_17070 [Bacteroidota bacterium]
MPGFGVGIGLPFQRKKKASAPSLQTRFQDSFDYGQASGTWVTLIGKMPLVGAAYVQPASFAGIAVDNGMYANNFNGQYTYSGNPYNAYTFGVAASTQAQGIAANGKWQIDFLMQERDSAISFEGVAISTPDGLDGVAIGGAENGLLMMEERIGGTISNVAVGANPSGLGVFGSVNVAADAGSVTATFNFTNGPVVLNMPISGTAAYNTIAIMSDRTGQPSTDVFQQTIRDVVAKW